MPPRRRRHRQPRPRPRRRPRSLRQVPAHHRRRLPRRASPCQATPSRSRPTTYAVVVTDDLRVRSKPGVTDDSKKLEPLLQQPMSLLVLDGPVQASGYDWYQRPADPLRHGHNDVPVRMDRGRRQGRRADRIEPRAKGCPSVPETVDDLGSITQTAPMYYEITCFGGDEITFQARIGSSEIGCDLEPPWGVDPVWLDPCKGPTYLEPIEPAADSWRLVPTWSPGIDTSMAGQYGDPPERLADRRGDRDVRSPGCGDVPKPAQLRDPRVARTRSGVHDPRVSHWSSW